MCNNNKLIMKWNHLLTMSIRNPRYLWYVYRNHSPFIFRMIDNSNKSVGLKLGQEIELKKLHVILRTTDFVMNINASRQLEGLGVKTKNDVIRFGGCSLFKAASLFSDAYGEENIQITLVADRLSDKGLKQYGEAAKDVGLSFDVIKAKGHGNGPTFQTQIDIALKDGDDTLALILEDDYMLSEESFITCFRIIQKYSNVIGMNPHFHPDRIRRQDIGKLVVIDGNLFSQIYKTCCTFFIPVQKLRRYEKWFRVYEGQENGSINMVWGKGICLAPLGWTLAEHLHRSDLSPSNSLLKNHGNMYNE